MVPKKNLQRKGNLQQRQGQHDLQEEALVSELTGFTSLPPSEYGSTLTEMRMDTQRKINSTVRFEAV